MAWALVSGATFRRFDSSPAPRRADVLETGDFGGDKLAGCRVTWENLGGLTCYVGSTSAGCRVRRWLTLRCASAG